MVAAAKPFDPSALIPELTVDETADVLNVNPKTIRRYLAQGALIARDAAPPTSKRPTWRIPLDAVLEMRGAYAKQGESRPARRSATRLAPYTPRNFSLLS